MGAHRTVLGAVRAGEQAILEDFFSTREGALCSREIRNRLGHALRTAYEPVVTQGLPEPFGDLLRRLDQRNPG